MTSSASRGQSRTVIARTQLIKKDVFLNQSGRWSVTLRCCCTPPGTGTAVRIHSLPHRERHGYPWKTRFSMDHSGYGISEFESYMPSQPVESLRRGLHGCRNPRHSGRLGGVDGVSGPGFTHYRRSNRRFSDPGLCSADFNIRTGRRETGSIMGRDRTDDASHRFGGAGASRYRPAG